MLRSWVKPSLVSSMWRRHATTAVQYTRRGDQPATAPLAITSLTKTSQGISVATVDERGPVSSLAIVIKAGSRDESLDTPGVAHLLKNSLIRNVPGDNIVRTIREAELRGNTLYTAHTRENIVVATEFLRDDLVDAVPLLLNNVFNSSFESYEFIDARETAVAETDASLADPSTQVVEALHRAAFRHGLGNSLFVSKAASKNLKRATLKEFIGKYFTSDRIAIVGSGVSQQDLAPLVEETLESLNIPSATTSVSATPSKYFGGEVRIDAGPKSQAHFAIAFPSVGFSSNDYAAALVLKSLLDGTPRVQYGSESGSSTLLAGAATPSTSISTFNNSYTDAGLFGFYIQGKTSEVAQVAQKSLEALKSVAKGSGFSDVSLARAKKTAIVDYESDLNREAQVQTVAAQVLSSGAIRSTSDVAADIAKVTVADLVKLAKLIVSHKPTVVARGHTAQLPFADQLTL